MEKLIDKDHSLVIWPDYITAKDINQMILDGMTSDEVFGIIKDNTYNGLFARMALMNWKKI